MNIWKYVFLIFVINMKSAFLIRFSNFLGDLIFTINAKPPILSTSNLCNENLTDDDDNDN